MDIKAMQRTVRKLLKRVEYPRVGTIIGLQEEVGHLSRCIMDIEIYNKPQKGDIEKYCVSVLFSLVDLCNAYNIDLSSSSQRRLQEIKNKIKEWEKEYGEELRYKKQKFD
jgi:hypothetical protein